MFLYFAKLLKNLNGIGCIVSDSDKKVNNLLKG